MKVLLISDEDFFGQAGLRHTLQVIIEFPGHEVRYIDAPLVYEKYLRYWYRPETAEHVLTVARDFGADCVIMFLRGSDPSVQIDLATAIHQETPASRFFFMSSAPQDKQLDVARARGLVFHFRVMPFPPEDLLAVIEQAA